MKGREGRRRSGSNWWVLVAGEETNKNLSAWLRAAAVHGPPVVGEREGARERERTRRDAEYPDGRGTAAYAATLRNNNNKERTRTGLTVGLLLCRVFFFFEISLFSSFFFCKFRVRALELDFDRQNRISIYTFAFTLFYFIIFSSPLPGESFLELY
jgi:hypothetical protein